MSATSRRNRSSAQPHSRTRARNRSSLRSNRTRLRSSAWRPCAPSSGRTNQACSTNRSSLRSSRRRVRSSSWARRHNRSSAQRHSRNWARRNSSLARHSRSRGGRRTPRRLQRYTARRRRQASTTGQLSSGGSLTGLRILGRVRGRRTPRSRPVLVGWRRCEIWERSTVRINAADTLSQ
jgi:hypothetical protein